MKIDKLLTVERIELDFEAKDKKNVLQQLSKLFSKAYPGIVQKNLFSSLLKRENLGSTGIGGGVAIPHARLDKVTAPAGFLAVSKQGIEFNSLDGEAVHLFFLMVYPKDSIGEHLKALAKVAKLMRDKFVRDSVLAADSPEKVIQVLVSEESREEALRPVS